MKTYDYEVTLRFIGSYDNMKNKQQAIETIQESFADEFNISVTDKEIKLKEVKP